MLNELFSNRLFYSYMNCRKSQVLRFLREKIPVEWLLYHVYEHPSRTYHEVLVEGKNGWSYPWDIDIHNEQLGLYERKQAYDDFNSAKSDLIACLERHTEAYIWTRNTFIPHMELTQSDPQGIHSLTLTAYDDDHFQVIDYPFERAYTSDIIRSAFDHTPTDRRTISTFSVDDFHIDQSKIEHVNHLFKQRMIEMPNTFESYDDILNLFLHAEDKARLIDRSIQYFGVLSLSRLLTGLFMNMNRYSDTALYSISELGRFAESIKNYLMKIAQAPHRLDLNSLQSKVLKLKQMEVDFLTALQLELETGIQSPSRINALTSIAGLEALHRTDTSIWLTWQDELRERQWLEYEVFLDGELIGTTSSDSFIIGHLLPCTPYSISVRSKNQFGQQSEQVTIEAATTDRITVGNLSRYKPVYASSTEEQFACVHVVDEDGSTRWSSAYTDNEWIYIDLGAENHIRRIQLLWEGAYASEYQIQCSNDAANWMLIKHVADGMPGAYEVDELQLQARYIRVLGIKRATIFGYSLWEMSVYN